MTLAYPCQSVSQLLIINGYWGSYGFIDTAGHILIEPAYPYANDFSEGLAFVSTGWDSLKNRQWICIDTTGTIVFRLDKGLPQTDFSEGIATITDITSYWFIDRRGKRIIPQSYAQCLFGFSEGLADVALTRFGNSGYIDLTGNLVIDTLFRWAGKFEHGKAKIWKVPDGWGVVTTTGQYLVAPQYDELGDIQKPLIRASQHGKFGFIRPDGSVAVPFIYTSAWDFSNGLAPVKVDTGWQYINLNGDLAFPQMFSDASEFACGLAAVKVHDKWGYIDTSGTIVIDPQFIRASQFSDGVAGVTQTSLGIMIDGASDALIDTHGSILQTGQFNTLQHCGGGLLRYWEGYHFTGRIRYMDTTGTILW